MMISVIIPMYNASSTIKRCINSVIKQKYSDLEIIIIDDGSTDDSAKIIKSIDDKRIKYFWKENGGGGAVSAYKKGIEFATGEYTAMIDSDDEVGPFYFLEMINSLKGNDVDIIATGFTSVNNGRKTIASNYLKNGIYHTDSVSIICRKAFSKQYDIIPVRWNKLYKTSILKEISSLLNERIVQREDNYFTYLVMKKAKMLLIDNNNVDYIYHFSNNSVTRRIDLLFWNKSLYSINELLRISQNEIECSRLMLDVFYDSLNKYIDDRIKLRDLKKLFSEVSSNFLILCACKEKKLYTKKERIIIYLINNEKYNTLIYFIKLMRILSRVKHIGDKDEK